MLSSCTVFLIKFVVNLGVYVNFKYPISSVKWLVVSKCCLFAEFYDKKFNEI